MIRNKYLIENLDGFLEMQIALKQKYNRLISEMIHSSFIVAHDLDLKPVEMSLDGKRYVFIFTDEEEFIKAFPADDVVAMDFEFNVLKGFINYDKFDGLILNVSSHNFYLTGKFLNDLEDVPCSSIDHSGAYSSEELKLMKNLANNEILEQFIKGSGNFSELIELISSNVLFALAVSDKDMDILEFDGVIETWGLDDRFEYYSHDQYVALFTTESKMNDIETSKFKYISLVDFATIVHYTIKNEFEGIIINPDDENYIIPIELLLKNWALINQTCFDYNLVTAKNTLFVIDDTDSF